MLISEPRLAARWILDPGLQARSPRAQIPHPSRGPSRGPLSPHHSHPPCPACPLPSGAPLTRLPFQMQRPLQKDPRPLLQPVNSKSGFLYNSDVLCGGVEDVGEAEALPHQR